MQVARNCEGKYNPSPVKVFDKVFYQCPVSFIDPGAARLIGVINLCEGGGLGSSRVLPSAILEEAEFYFSVRTIVLSEQSRVQRWKDEKEKAKQ